MRPKKYEHGWTAARGVTLTYPEPQYEDRLTTLAQGVVHPDCTKDQITAAIDERRRIEGDHVAEDFRRICYLIYKSIFDD